MFLFMHIFYVKFSIAREALTRCFRYIIPFFFSLSDVREALEPFHI